MLLILGLSLLAASSTLFVLMRSDDPDLVELGRHVTLYLIVAPGIGTAMILILKHFFGG